MIEENKCEGVPQTSGTKTLKEINAEFSSDTYKVLPFISDIRITRLEKGLYQKHNAKFRGITAIYDDEEGVYKYPLYGMYKVTENLVVVPASLDLTKGKYALLDALIKAGYKKVSCAPKFETVYYPEDSIEARLALENKFKYNETQKQL